MWRPTVTALAGDAGWTRCQNTSVLEELGRASLGLSFGGSGVFGILTRQRDTQGKDQLGGVRGRGEGWFLGTICLVIAVLSSGGPLCSTKGDIQLILC